MSFEAIAEAVEKHLELPEIKREQLSQKARQFVLGNYSWEQIVKKLVSIYSLVLEQTLNCIKIT